MGHGLRECRRLTDQTFNAGLLGGLQLHLVAFLLHHLMLLLLLHLQLATEHSHASPSAGNTTQSCFIFSWQHNTVMLHLQLATQHSHASSSAGNTTQSCFIFSWQHNTSHASPSAGNTTQPYFTFSWKHNTAILHLQLATQHSHTS